MDILSFKCCFSVCYELNSKNQESLLMLKKKHFESVIRSVVLSVIVISVLWCNPCRLHAAEKSDEAKELERRKEGAIQAGLKFLAKHQKKTGQWQSYASPTAATTLAGLAFLANGHGVANSPYRENIDGAVNYVSQAMQAGSYDGKGEKLMYVEGLALQFLIHDLGTGKDKIGRKQEQAKLIGKNVKQLIDTQKMNLPKPATGGWRYSPSSVSTDLWATSWAVTALRAARQAGYLVPENTFEAAIDFIDGAFRERKAGGYGFVCRAGVSVRPDIGATSAAILVKTMIDGHKDELVQKAIPYLTETYAPPKWDDTIYPHGFYWDNFYISSALYVADKALWREFRPELVEMLLEHQKGDGHWEFPPNNRAKDRRLGDMFSTAMAVLILAQDKHYLPMYWSVKRLYSINH
jgi:hypothetical protein